MPAHKDKPYIPKRRTIPADVSMKDPEVRSPAPYVVIVVGVVVLILVALAVTSGYLFPPEIERNVSLEMFRAIVAVDGVLIGFVGLVANYALRELKQTIDEFARAIMPSTPAGTNAASIRSQLLLRAINRLSARRWTTVLVTGLALILFVMSILTGLAAMSRLGIFDYAEPRAFFLPICTMIGGIVFILLVLVLVAMGPRR